MAIGNAQATSPDVITRNKAIARRVCEEVWNKGNFDAMSDLFVQDVRILHNDMSLTKGIEELIPGIKSYRNAFPDLKMSIDKQIAEDDTVVNILTLQGTHTGGPFKAEYKDFEPTGQKVSQKRIAVQRFNDQGKIVEVLSVHQPFFSEGRLYE